MAGRHRGREVGVAEGAIEAARHWRKGERSGWATAAAFATWLILELTDELPGSARIPVAVALGAIVLTGMSLVHTRQQFVRGSGRHIKRDRRL
jgi:hypothetical protein